MVLLWSCDLVNFVLHNAFRFGLNGHIENEGCYEILPICTASLEYTGVSYPLISILISYFLLWLCLQIDAATAEGTAGQDAHARPPRELPPAPTQGVWARQQGSRTCKIDCAVFSF